MDVRWLGEVAEAGAQAASSSIARLTGQRVRFEALEAQETGLASFASERGATGVIGASLRLRGALRGALVLAFPPAVARSVAAAMLATRALSGSDAQALSESALKELANIAGAGYVGAARRHLGIEVDQSVPTLAAAGWEPLVRYTFLGTAPGAERAWVAGARIHVEGSGSGDLFLLLDASVPPGASRTTERAPSA